MLSADLLGVVDGLYVVVRLEVMLSADLLGVIDGLYVIV